MSQSLRMALVVPDVHYAWDDERQFRIRELKEHIGAGDVDLVVFPEAYEYATRGEAQARADAWANEMSIPVLVGVSLHEGYELAAYRNPWPRRGETAAHLYVKHSTSPRLAFEWPNYGGACDAMFEPISLLGSKLGVQICHDMFFGLIGARLRARGATTLVDLTGGGVNLSKWNNVIQARSIELGGPFFCTMARRPGDGGAAVAIGYTRGRPMRPVLDKTRDDGAGGFAVFEIGDSGYEGDDAFLKQSFSDKIYEDILVGFGLNPSSSVDVAVTVAGGRLVASGPRPIASVPGWQGFLTSKGKLGVLLLPLGSLTDGLAIHRAEPPAGTFDHHLVVYGDGRSGANPSEVIALLRLRAIEHRVAAAALTPNLCELIKTNRYKNIQRMKSVDGRFGLDGHFLGGSSSGARDGTSLGIPNRFMTRYRALLGT